MLKTLYICMALVALAAGTFGCSSGKVNTGASTVTGDSNPSYERLLRNIVASDSPSAPPGVVALVRDARGTWRGAAGSASLRPSEAMRPDDRFRVGSVTKTFTATLVLQLVGEGELRLNDTVERWIPGLLPEGERITVRQLLNHTSGLYNYTASASFGRELEQKALGGTDLTLTPQETIALAAKKRPYFEPGTSWKYSNTNYQVLGLIVERVTGSSFEEELERRILRPLDLGGTSLESGVIRGPHAHGYFLADGPRSLPGGRPFDVSDASLGAWADGALVSQADDLATFFGALLDGTLLPPRLLKTMLAPTGEVPYGLGITRSDLRCGRAWGHGGEGIGYVTNVLASADGKKIVVLAANAWSQGNIVPEGVDAEDFFCPY